MMDDSSVRFGLLLLSALILVSDTFADCDINQFQCDSGRCIARNWECDYSDDCGDQSDEQNCVCYNNFGCNNGECIDWSYRCDGDYECSDNSDEWGCPSTTTTAWTTTTTTRPVTTQSSCPGQYRCSYSGSCISNRWLCDGDDDCLLGDDESSYQCSLTTQYSNSGRKEYTGFNYRGVIGGVCAGVAVVVIIVVMSIIKRMKTTAGRRGTGAAVGLAVTTTSNGMRHAPPSDYPGFGAPQAYPNGYSAHPGGYPITGMGPHPGGQPGPYGAPPGVNPPPYPGVQQHQPPMAAGYQGVQAPHQQPPMATGYPGMQGPHQHPQPKVY